MISSSLRRAAERSNHSRFFHAAQVKLGNRVIATGHNTVVNNGSLYQSEHAECAALRKASRNDRDLRGATVVSIRVTRGGKLASAKPCNACMKRIRIYGIKKVIYSTSAGTLETFTVKEAA